jgi:cytochrome P450
MRLHPVAPIGALRVTDTDTALPGGERIPAHSLALILTLAIQRDPKVFVDPDNFIPQRWEKASDEMNLSWLAFGSGASIMYWASAGTSGTPCRFG